MFVYNHLWHFLSAIGFGTKHGGKNKTKTAEKESCSVEKKQFGGFWVIFRIDKHAEKCHDTQATEI